MKTLYLACLGAALLPAVSGAASMRCGASIVEEGVDVATLVAKCGQPSDKQVVTEDVRSHVASGGSVKTGVTQVERWTYKRSSGALTMLVTIADGAVRSIETLP